MTAQRTGARDRLVHDEKSWPDVRTCGPAERMGESRGPVLQSCAQFEKRPMVEFPEKTPPPFNPEYVHRKNSKNV